MTRGEASSTAAAGVQRTTGMETVFRGFARNGRPLGVRNVVLVLPSVICSRIVADRIADRVEGAVSAPHDHGCGQLGADAEQTERTFLGVASNPNVAGTLVVGLGCETIQSDRVAGKLEERGHPVQEVNIQDEGGSDQCTERGIAAVESLVESGRSDRVEGSLSDLTIGVVGGDLADSSVEHADPLVGDVVEELVSAGGRVVLAGADRVLPHADALLDSADMDLHHQELSARDGSGAAPWSQVRQQAATRSPDEVARLWGGRPIETVLRYGERASHDSGVALVDAPSAFDEAATALAAAGAQLVVHVTDQGVPTGHPIVPTIRLTGNAETYDALEADIDLDVTASTPSDLIDVLTRVAGGEPCRAERHGLTQFAITRVGPSM